MKRCALLTADAPLVGTLIDTTGASELSAPSRSGRPRDPAEPSRHCPHPRTAAVTAPWRPSPRTAGCASCCSPSSTRPSSAASRSMCALARGLVERGHEVAVATLTTAAENGPAHASTRACTSIAPGHVQRIGFLYATERRHAIPLADPELVGGLRRLARDFKPDVVHAHNWLGRSYVPLKREIGAPYVVSLHDSGRICTQGRMMYRGQELCTGPTFGRCLSCCAVQFGAAKGSRDLPRQPPRAPRRSARDRPLPAGEQRRRRLQPPRGRTACPSRSSPTSPSTRRRGCPVRPPSCRASRRTFHPAGGRRGRRQGCRRCSSRRTAACRPRPRSS